MTASPKPSLLWRYTDLPALLHFLRTGAITLLDPKTWDDRNDSHYLSVYKENRGLESVLALCFSQLPETYHHWSVFSRGCAGVCIIFDRSLLLETLSEYEGIRSGPVKYLAIKSARPRAIRTRELPFLKRVGYKPEGEFRVIFESRDETLPSLQIPVANACIRRISLSPWLHSSLSSTTVATIRSIPGCEQLHISRSTLISNEQWKALAQNAA